jgi:putative zinc finger protein
MTMDCDDAITAFADYLAHDLPPTELEAFLGHLRGCGRCGEKLLALELYLHMMAGPAAVGEAPQSAERG